MLLEYVPGSYWLSLNVSNALHCGASAGDVAESCEPALRLIRAGRSESDPDVVESWIEGWAATADRLVRDAGIWERSSDLSTGRACLRAAAHLMIAEWLAPHAHARKYALFAEMRTAFREGVNRAHPAAEFVEIPYDGMVLDGLFVPAATPGPAPTVVHFNGTHSTLEWPYLTGMADALARRGIASLCFDHPGSGSARSFRGLTLRPDSEHFASAAIDYLATRSAVDQDRIAVMGGSMGGYHAPRAAAFDRRVRACVCWGALYELPQWLIDYALDPSVREGAPLRDARMSEALAAIFGAAVGAPLARELQRYSLEGIANRIACPLLVVHGRNDRQVPLEQARRLVVEARRSRGARLVEAGPALGEEHCNLDNLPAAVDLMTDWLAATLATKSVRQ